MMRPILYAILFSVLGLFIWIVASFLAAIAQITGSTSFGFWYALMYISFLTFLFAIPIGIIAEIILFIKNRHKPKEMKLWVYFVDANNTIVASTYTYVPTKGNKAFYNGKLYPIYKSNGVPYIMVSA